MSGMLITRPGCFIMILFVIVRTALDAFGGGDGSFRSPDDGSALTDRTINETDEAGYEEIFLGNGGLIKETGCLLICAANRKIYTYAMQSA